MNVHGRAEKGVAEQNKVGSTVRNLDEGVLPCNFGQQSERKTTDRVTATAGAHSSQGPRRRTDAWAAADDGQVGRFPDHLPDQIMPLPPPAHARARTRPRCR